MFPEEPLCSLCDVLHCLPSSDTLLPFISILCGEFSQNCFLEIQIPGNSLFSFLSDIKLIYAFNYIKLNNWYLWKVHHQNSRQNYANGKPKILVLPNTQNLDAKNARRRGELFSRTSGIILNIKRKATTNNVQQTKTNYKTWGGKICCWIQWLWICSLWIWTKILSK